MTIGANAGRVNVGTQLGAALSDEDTLPPSAGGTGNSNLLLNGVVVGQGLAAVVVTDPGDAGQVLTSNGPSAPPSMQDTGTGTVTTITASTGLDGGTINTIGTIALLVPVDVTLGGTSTDSLTSHGLLVGAGTGAIVATSPGTLGQVLISQGASADPTWGSVTGTGTVTTVIAGTGLSGGTITGSGTIALITPVTVPFGGTGITTGTAHGVVIAQGTSAFATTTAGVSGQVLTSQGASTDPTWTTVTGTGTVTTITASTGLSGGTITNSGTISLIAPVTVALGGTNATSSGSTASNNIGALAISNNLSDLLTASVARVNIGLSTFPVGFYQNATMSAAQTMIRFAAPFAFSLPVAMAGSTVAVGTNATASATFLVKKAGSNVGTITVSSTGSAAFTMATTTSFAINDVLTITAPATADTALADIGVTLLATR